jgi:MFS family permease
MQLTILVLLGGLSVVLIGVGLLGTLLGVRATLAAFGNLEIGAIMAAYYGGYLLGTQLGPGIIARVGHIRAFAAFAALNAACVLAFGLWIRPEAWFVLRLLNGAAVVGIYMVVESWLNAQTPTALRGRVFASYMVSTLLALAAGQYLLLAYRPEGLELFALATILITLGLIPIAITRVTEPGIEHLAPLGLRRLFALSPLGTIGSLTAGIVNGIFWGMTPVFAQRLQMSAAEIANLMSATIAGGALLQYPIGHLSDRHDRRSVLIAVSFATAAVAAVAGYLVLAGLPGLIVAAFLYGGLMFSLYSISVAHTNDHLDVTHTLAATQGLLFVYGFGALAGPLLGGAAMHLSGPVGLPMLSSIILLLLGVFGLARVLKRAPPPLADQAEFVPLVRTTPVVLEMHPDTEVAPELDLGRPDKDGA